MVAEFCVMEKCKWARKNYHKYVGFLNTSNVSLNTQRVKPEGVTEYTEESSNASIDAGIVFLVLSQNIYFQGYQTV